MAASPVASTEGDGLERARCPRESLPSPRPRRLPLGRATSSTAPPSSSARMAASSSALSGLAVASTNLMSSPVAAPRSEPGGPMAVGRSAWPGPPVASGGSRRCRARRGEHLVELGAGERRAFCGPLHLDESPRGGHDDVQVDFGGGVLDVVEVEHADGLDDPDRDGRARLAYGMVIEHLRLAEPGAGVVQRRRRHPISRLCVCLRRLAARRSR